ncbi:VCBS repeat-containing protein [Nannocystis sp.]|uniref:FG-GAP repeat domain-containing protein n=1 Tax=Nannocystis sp. TaxID=1962667 RepID=UPI0025D630DC|nr:VCBS repeat-containing protein [Nannocystis sp.]MBK7828433.1 VCBS repeat-containing protein [Nannocystis sp.]
MQQHATRLSWLGWLLLGACGDNGGRADESAGASTGAVTLTNPSTGETGTPTTGSATGEPPPTSSSDTGAACNAELCPEGECIADACCPIALACKDVCCDDGQVCSFQQCVVPGDTCIDATECPEGSYCEYSLGDPGTMGGDLCQGGARPATGKCLPAPPECPPGVEPEGDDIDCLAQCEVMPEKSFEPQLKYAWTGGDVMMPPIVIQLDDDNCDQIVDERDIPEIVFSSFEAGAYNSGGTLRAVSVKDGAVVEKWSVKPMVDDIWGGRGIAGGNIDGLPGNEIVACTASLKARAFTAEGVELWTSTAVGCDQPALTDLDGDGQVEVLLEGAVLDGKTGALELSFDAPGMSWWHKKAIAADADGDGALEIVTTTRILEADGTVLADSGLGGTFPAIADFDLDGLPEIVVVDNVHGTGTHFLHLWRYSAVAPGKFEVLRQGLDLNNGASTVVSCGAMFEYGGGPPTVADFDGDGTPDVGVAGAVGYIVFSGARLMDPNVAPTDTVLWFKTTQDCSSAFTGSSVFDFDGNGKAEVVYADEQYMRIYDGTSGEVLTQVCNTSGTLHEYPLVADVDGDGQADIVVTSNSYSDLICPVEQMKTQGVRVFGDTKGQWVRTRRVWNQHAYHVTNIGEDGQVPAAEASNWTVPRLNNFRQNVQPEGEFAAPDLVVSGRTECIDGLLAFARVRNLGQAAVPAGVVVGFYEGDPDQGGTLLGTGATTKPLYPAEGQDVVLELQVLPAGFVDGSQPLVLIVDDGDVPHSWVECRTDNNRTVLAPACKAIG